MENLNLTAEEVALIKEKRANDLEAKKQEAIKNATERANTKVLENQRLENFYRSYFDMLRVEAEKKDGVSFKLEITESTHHEPVYRYDEGVRVDEEPISYTLKNFKIIYTGKTVPFREYYLDEDGDEMMHHGDDFRVGLFTKDAEYNVVVKMHQADGGYRTVEKGFKMYINGLCDDNKGQRMTSASGVIKIILDDIEIKKHVVTNRELGRNLKAKALNEATKFFPNAKDITEYNRLITVSFENGVRLEMHYYTDDNPSGVKFVTNKVNAYGVDPIKLGNFLQNLSK